MTYYGIVMIVYRYSCSSTYCLTVHTSVQLTDSEYYPLYWTILSNFQSDIECADCLSLLGYTRATSQSVG